MAKTLSGYVVEKFKALPANSKVRAAAAKQGFDKLAKLAGVEPLSELTHGETVVARFFAEAAAAEEAESADPALAGAGMAMLAELQKYNERFGSVETRRAAVRAVDTHHTSDRMAARYDARVDDEKRLESEKAAARRRNMSPEDKAADVAAETARATAREEERKKREEESTRSAVAKHQEHFEGEARAAGWKPSRQLQNREEFDREVLLRKLNGGEHTDYQVTPELRAELAKEQLETEAADKMIARLNEGAQSPEAPNAE